MPESTVDIENQSNVDDNIRDEVRESKKISTKSQDLLKTTYHHTNLQHIEQDEKIHHKNNIPNLDHTQELLKYQIKQEQNKLHITETNHKSHGDKGFVSTSKSDPFPLSSKAQYSESKQQTTPVIFDENNYNESDSTDRKPTLKKIANNITTFENEIFFQGKKKQSNKRYDLGNLSYKVNSEDPMQYKLRETSVVPEYMHVNSSSLSTNKNYMMEGSLFFPNEESVLVFGGIDPHNVYGEGRNTGKDIYRYRPHVNSWELVGELPEPRHHHSVAILKGRIFLVGGADPRDDDNTGKSVTVGSVWSFDPITRIWCNESEMLIPRKNFGLVVSNGKLYAIGGQDKEGRVLSSVECFNPSSRSWKEVASLSVGRMGIAATKFRDFIWIAGGMASSKTSSLSDNVECYDTRRNVWMPVGSLRFPRCFSNLFHMNDTLFLIGGAGHINDLDGSATSIGSIDTWDDTIKDWLSKDEMAIPRHGHSSAYLGTQILIIGGVTTMYMRALSNVECFCCVRGTWIHGVANLPTPLSGHGSITLPPASLM